MWTTPPLPDGSVRSLGVGVCRHGSTLTIVCSFRGFRRLMAVESWKAFSNFPRRLSGPPSVAAIGNHCFFRRRISNQSISKLFSDAAAPPSETRREGGKGRAERGCFLKRRKHGGESEPVAPELVSGEDATSICVCQLVYEHMTTRIHIAH